MLLSIIFQFVLAGRAKIKYFLQKLLADYFFAYLFFIFISGAIGSFGDGIGGNIEFLYRCEFLRRLGLWIPIEFF